MTRWLPARLYLTLALVAAAADTTTAASKHINLYGWHIQLHANEAIRSPYYDACQFYKGRIIDEPDSTVTLTECENKLYGLIQVKGEDFVLEPKSDVSEGAHVVRRRDVMLAEHAPVYDLTGDTVDDLELEFEEEESPRTHVFPRHRHTTETDYFRNLIPVTRSLSGAQDLWLEMAVIADHTMVKFHGRNKVKHYILALMNIVSAIFNDPSLGSNMTLVINKLFLYEEQDSIIKYGNVKKSLEGVNRWNYRHLYKLPSSSAGWDAAVWLTREQLGGPSGFAPVGGVCSRKRSAAIDRDEGLTSAFVIAHELAHLLGLTHDGNGQCDFEARQGSVMAPTVLATLHNFAWSSCSKKQFHEKSINWHCLHQRGSEDGVTLGGGRELSSYVFTMDEQCRSEFGEGFSVCKTVKMRSPCARLWCAHRAMPHVCRSKRAPPHEGTPCRKNHWCVDGVCEPMPGFSADDEEPRPPRWEEWSAWSPCRADCGYGLKTRHRACTGRGSSETEACEGASTEAAICWTGRACAGSRDIRADLCRRQNYQYIPHLHTDESKHCQIWCVNYTGGEPVTFGTLPDGTACSYDRPYDLCFQGTCVKGDCNSSDPVCNWCPDGYCNNNTHYYSSQLEKRLTRLSVIPHGAHQLTFHIHTPVPLEIAIKEKRKDKPLLRLTKQHSIPYKVNEDNYLKYDIAPQNLQIVEVDNNVIELKEERFGLQGSVVAAGTVLEWTQTDTDVVIMAKSQLYTDLMILGAPRHPDSAEEPVVVQVSVNYSTTPAPMRPKEYRWATERGPCSSSCGGGVRAVRTRCVHGQHRCLPTRYEQCNTHRCEFTWAGGEWEECSVSCGDQGLQERQLFCLPVNASSATSRRELIEHSVSPALCKSESPERQQRCNQVPCPVYWQEMPWTPCSTTCGRGISRRPLTCPADNESLCGPKPRERRRHCRLRRCPTRHFTCPTPDRSQYCELFSKPGLARNCIIPTFRKYCCKSCLDVMSRT